MADEPGGARKTNALYGLIFLVLGGVGLAVMGFGHYTSQMFMVSAILGFTILLWSGIVYRQTRKKDEGRKSDK